MRKYMVDGSRREFVTEEIDAESMGDAVEAFRIANPEFTPDAVVDVESDSVHEHIGRCEGCSKDLFDTDAYSVVSEGDHYVCHDCLPLIAD